MDNRRRQKNRRRILIITVIIIVFSSLSLFFQRTQTGLEKIIGDSISIVEYYVIKRPIEFVAGIFNEYNDLKDVYNENRILKEQLASYASESANSNALVKELDELKALTGIEFLPTEYERKSANVIRNLDTWNSEITIDIGSMAGISEDMVVINSQGMIGTVISVSEVTATVQLLTVERSNNNVPVEIQNGEQTIYGLIDGYDSETDLLEVTIFDTIDRLEEGARVMTSGLGGDGKAPRGIYIGTGDSLDVSSDGTTRKVYVKAAADFNDLTYVSVVQRKNGDE